MSEQKRLAINETLQTIMPYILKLGQDHCEACMGSLISFVLLNLLVDYNNQLSADKVEMALDALRQELRHTIDTNNFQFQVSQ